MNSNGGALLTEGDRQDPLATVYLREPGTFRPLALVRRGPDGIRHYHLDHLGTPVAVTNDDGRAVWRNRTRAWGGAATALAVEGEAQPIRFPGQYHDAETGLHYNRFRYYAPEEGCYVQQDPVSLVGGTNLTSYVGGDPIGWFDTLGLTAAQLYSAMKAAGMSRPPNTAAHHIVPETDPAAAEARDVLAKQDIDINGADNGVFLQSYRNTDSNVPGILHSGMHPNAYLQVVTARLSDAEQIGGAHGVLDERGQMRNLLQSAPRGTSWWDVLK